MDETSNCQNSPPNWLPFKVAAIVASTDATRAAKAITTSVPIIFVTGAEPVATGLVSSINRPGGNITGVSFNALPVTGKRLELLRQLVPKAELIAVLQDPTYVQHQTETSLIETAARTLGQKIITFKTGSEQEIDAAFPAIAKSGAGALFVGVGQVFTSRRNQLVGLAALHAIPASFALAGVVAAGKLTSYGASQTAPTAALVSMSLASSTEKSRAIFQLSYRQNLGC